MQVLKIFGPPRQEWEGVDNRMVDNRLKGAMRRKEVAPNEIFEKQTGNMILFAT